MCVCSHAYVCVQTHLCVLLCSTWPGAELKTLPLLPETKEQTYSRPLLYKIYIYPAQSSNL